MQLINIAPYVFAALFLFIGVRGTYLAVIIHRARKKARFAIEYGVWRRDQFGRELLVAYHDNLGVTMDHILNWRVWRVSRLIADRHVPMWRYCEQVQPMTVSNEQMLYLMRRLEWAEKAISTGKTCTIALKDGYEMSVDVKTFKDIVYEGLTGVRDGENCIIDIFTQNGMSWKHQPKQPENSPIMPNKTSN